MTIRTKRAFYALLCVLAVLVLADVGASFFMLDYALKPANKGRDIPARYKGLVADYPYLKPWVDSLRQHHALHDTTVLASDGDHHHAVYLRAPHPTNRVAVVVHGYTDCFVMMLPIAKIYADMGYNLLIPDLHGNGLSEGDHQQMGWFDRKDVMQWMAIANQLFSDSNSTTQMVVHGWSMGAATTMCVAGEPLPSYAKCFVEDCGYTSTWDEFAGQLKEQFSLPEFPLMYSTSLLCRLRYGWSFGQASPLRQIAHCKAPMLFIHGSDDDFVPTRMVYPLFKTKPGLKELWVAQGSKHARSIHDHPNEYTAKVRAFVSKYIK